MGYRYKHNSKSIDYNHLSQWCKDREGQVIVCESNDASWLPFRTLYNNIGAVRDGKGGRKSVELIWTNT